jgi:hypothetical protein
MASTAKKRKVTRTTSPLTRDMLLPMAATLARKVSLQNHMALVALRQGEGNADLVAELLRTVFIAFYLVDAGGLAPHTQAFIHAETTLKTVIKEAAHDKDWHLGEEHCEGIKTVLALHDAQLASLPVHRIERAKQWLMRVLEAGSLPVFTMGSLQKTENKAR